MKAAGIVVGLLLASSAGAAAPPPAGRAWADARRCPVGQPVAVMVWVAAGPGVGWHLTDAAFRQPGVAVLAAGSAVPAGGGQQHRVVFTATAAGRWRLGPFAVLLPRPGGRADTLVAPAVEVDFRPEPLAAALHPLRAGQPGWPDGADAWPWRTGGAGLLLGAGAVCWLLARRKPAALPAGGGAGPARWVALRAVAALEQAQAAGTTPATEVLAQLFAILTTYLQQLPTGPTEAGPAPGPAPAPATAPAQWASLLAALNHARFAPAPAVAGEPTGLLAQARHLLGEPATALNHLQTTPPA